MNYNIIAYSVYIPTTIGLSIWIAKSLHKNTKAFLMDKFDRNEELASSTNNLIQTGFYLISLGFSFMYMRIKEVTHYVNGVSVSNSILTGQEGIEKLAAKLGTFTLMLGILMFLNFFMMIKIQSPKKQSFEE